MVPINHRVNDDDDLESWLYWQWATKDHTKLTREVTKKQNERKIDWNKNDQIIDVFLEQRHTIHELELKWWWWWLLDAWWYRFLSSMKPREKPVVLFVYSAPLVKHFFAGKELRLLSRSSSPHAAHGSLCHGYTTELHFFLHRIERNQRPFIHIPLHTHMPTPLTCIP